MINSSDVHKAIQETLEAKITDISFEISDDETPDRPCIYINYADGIDKRATTKMELKRATFEVVYYASDSKNNYLELLKMKDKLERIFKCPVETIKDNKILSFDIANCESDIDKSTGTLSVMVDIDVYQTIDDDILNNSESRFESRRRNTNTKMIEELTSNGEVIEENEEQEEENEEEL